jgi:hypothetical protein
MIARHGNLEEKKRIAKKIAGIRGLKDKKHTVLYLLFQKGESKGYVFA